MKESFGRAVFLRIISSLLILFFLISFLFILLRISPGSPEQKYLSPQLSPELTQKVRQSFNLDKPLTEQYAAFLYNSIRGDFGVSYNYREPVFKVIINYLPFTLDKKYCFFLEGQRHHSLHHLVVLITGRGFVVEI